MLICVQILVPKKCNIKVLPILRRNPLEVDIKTKICKHLQRFRFPFIENNRYLSKVFISQVVKGRYHLLLRKFIGQGD